ncbi:hypothetical protein [Chondromyces apiculatus]|nr:hypothetical protein [Chondromyces apiculatus]
MLLIDPRREDPLRFLQLDLVWPFWFHPRAQRNCLAFARAAYTIEVLKLNHRDTLLNARESAYRSYRAHLTEYLEARDKRAATDHLQQLVDAFQRMNQRTVWHEMQRQQGQIAELRALFERAPEALSW